MGDFHVARKDHPDGHNFGPPYLLIRSGPEWCTAEWRAKWCTAERRAKWCTAERRAKWCTAESPRTGLLVPVSFRTSTRSIPADAAKPGNPPRCRSNKNTWHAVV